MINLQSMVADCIGRLKSHNEIVDVHRLAKHCSKSFPEEDIQRIESVVVKSVAALGAVAVWPGKTEEIASH